MPPEVHSLFSADGDGPTGRETFTTLLAGRRFRLEHIVSRGSAGAEGFWYDQGQPEWVALLCGEAGLEFPDGSLELRAGDCLLIPAGLRHRVARTSADAVWMALHFEPAADGEATR